MNKIVVSTTAFAILAGFGMASAQTVTFSTEDGHMLRQHATSQHYDSSRDPHFHAQVGATLPGSVQIHPLPDTLAPHMPRGHNYGYGMVNDHPVIVDHSSRRIIHSFD